MIGALRCATIPGVPLTSPSRKAAPFCVPSMNLPLFHRQGVRAGASAMIWPGRALCTSPRGPFTTSSRASPPGRQENTMSARSPTSAGEAADVPPIFSNSAVELRR